MSDARSTSDVALPWVQRRIENVLALLGLGAGGLTVGAFGAALWWPLDMATHFRVQYFTALIVIGIAMWCARRRRLAAAFVALSLVNLALIVPQYVAPPGLWAARGPSVRFMLLNVRTDNDRHDLVASEIRGRDPDVLVLLEVNDTWTEALTDVTSRYDESCVRTRDDNFGIAVFSRHPMEARAVRIADTPVPSIVARVIVAGVPLTVIATHPFPPYGGTGSRRRDRQLAALADLAAEIGGPLVVLGDLNATPWSAPFRALLRRSGLVDASRGRGIHATWPADLPPLLIPLDHCLHSAEVEILAETVGRHVGSDHRPLHVDARLPAPAPR